MLLITSRLPALRHRLSAGKNIKQWCAKASVIASVETFLLQIVLSRRFEQPFKGDDFKVYRALLEHQSLSLSVLLRLRRIPYLRLFTGNALQGSRRTCKHRPDCRHGFPHGRRCIGQTAYRSFACRSERECRACHAG